MQLQVLHFAGKVLDSRIIETKFDFITRKQTAFYKLKIPFLTLNLFNKFGFADHCTVKT